ncbi:hypothetical protein GCM10022284_28180 [Streptomyces hundungensis]
MAGGGELEGGRAVGGRVHLVLPRLEVDHERAHDLRLVLDHEHPGHLGYLPSAGADRAVADGAGTDGAGTGGAVGFMR